MLKILPRNSKRIMLYYLGKKTLSLLHDEFSKYVIQSQVRKPEELTKPPVSQTLYSPNTLCGRFQGLPHCFPAGRGRQDLGRPPQTATCFSCCGFGPWSTFIIFGRVCRILLDSNYIFQGRLPARARNDDQQALFNHLLRFQPWLVINVLWKPIGRATPSGYVTRLGRRTGKYHKQQRQKFGRS